MPDPHIFLLDELGPQLSNNRQTRAFQRFLDYQRDPSIMDTMCTKCRQRLWAAAKEVYIVTWGTDGFLR